MAKRGGFPGGAMPGKYGKSYETGAEDAASDGRAAKKSLRQRNLTATAGGGAVEVTVSGKREVTKVKLAEEVVDPDDIEMLEDLIVAATNEALRQIE